MGGSSFKSKKRRRDLPATDRNECHLTKQENAYKRTILSVTQPSYLLGLGSENVRPENRIRLCHLLQKLMRQHNWAEASGVLSILLKGTLKDKGARMNRFKYTLYVVSMRSSVKAAGHRGLGIELEQAVDDLLFLFCFMQLPIKICFLQL